MNEQQEKILQIIQAMFAAAPGKAFLDEFTSLVASGLTPAQLASNLADSNEFKNLRYSDSLTNAQFSRALVNDLVGAHIGHPKI